MQKYIDKSIKEVEEERESGEIKLETILVYLKSMTIIGYLVFTFSNIGFASTKVVIDFWLKD